jgi:opacity protein-like surface antigen
MNKLGSFLILSLLLSAASLPQQAGAQDAGFITGRASVTTTSVAGDDGSTTTGAFGPAVGFNVGDRFVVGLGLMYTGVTVSDEASFGGASQKVQDRNTMFTITPFARYMKTVSDDLSMYGQLAIGIGFGKITDEDLTLNNNGNLVVVETESKQSSFNFSIGPGLMYKLAPRWAISADWGALRYESRTVDPEGNDGDDDTTTNTFGLALTPDALTFGLNWLF